MPEKRDDRDHNDGGHEKRRRQDGKILHRHLLLSSQAVADQQVLDRGPYFRVRAALPSAPAIAARHECIVPHHARSQDARGCTRRKDKRAARRLSGSPEPWSAAELNEIHLGSGELICR
jgi:hypothetical protein